jgi:hypothetical protein
MASSLVSALIRHPGPNDRHENIVGAAREMLKSSDENTQRLLSILGLTDVPWAQFRVMKAVTQAVADKWRASADANRPSADVADLMPVWELLMQRPCPEKVLDDEPRDVRLAVQLALLEAMHPVIREIAVWSLEHDPTTAAVNARDRILDASVRSARSLLGADPSPDAHRMMTSALVRYGGTLYAAAWRKYAEKLASNIKGLPPERQKALMSQHVNGFPLAELDAAFTASFNKLIELVNFLTPGRQGNHVSSTAQHGGSVGERQK